MNHEIALSAIWLLLSVGVGGCTKSKDNSPLGTISGKSNTPFSLKTGQLARISTPVNDVQLTLTSIENCINNGVAIGTSSLTLHVTDGATSEDIKITIPKCSYQQGDSLAGVTTKANKIIVVNSVQYENTIGSAKGLSAKLTVK